MNAFADWLFALLMGWTRTLFNGVWNLITDQGGGFSSFLRNFWLPLIVILLIFGTLMDYVVWLIRWRPYFVWRSWFLRKARKRRMDRTNRYMNDLDQAPLDLPEYQQDEVYATQNAPIDFAFEPSPAYTPLFEPQAPQTPFVEQPQMPAWEAEYSYEPMQVDEAPLPQVNLAEEPALPVEDPYVPSLPWETPEMEAPVAEPAANWQPEPQAPEAPLYSFDDNVFVAPEEPAPAPVSPTRRRRAEAKRRRQSNLLKTMKETLFSPEDGSDAVDSLPPPVAVEDAFHKPYYPQNYNYKPQVLPPDNDPGQNP